MTREEVAQLAHRLGGTGLSGEYPEPLRMSDDPREARVLDVQFVDSITLCITGGNWYKLYFTTGWRLKSWVVERWGSAC
jgi:hypothetical protein